MWSTVLPMDYVPQKYSRFSLTHYLKNVGCRRVKTRHRATALWYDANSLVVSWQYHPALSVLFESCKLIFIQEWGSTVGIGGIHRRRHRGIDHPTFIPALLVLLFLGGLSPREQKFFWLAALALIIPPLANLSRRPWGNYWSSCQWNSTDVVHNEFHDSAACGERLEYIRVGTCWWMMD
jgi:hypothetical protein